MKPIFPHTMAGRKANKNTAGTHNLLLWVLSCCVLYGFASFWLSIFSLTCLPSYVPRNTWFISQFNNINKKEHSHCNDQLYFWKKPTVMHSQLACGVSCSVKRQYCTETRHDASLCYLSTTKCIQNYLMATISLQIQLHHQPWISGHSPSAPEMKMQVLSTYAEGESLLAFGWTQAIFTGDWSWSSEVLKYQN